MKERERKKKKTGFYARLLNVTGAATNLRAALLSFVGKYYAWNILILAIVMQIFSSKPNANM